MFKGGRSLLHFLSPGRCGRDGRTTPARGNVLLFHGGNEHPVWAKSQPVGSIYYANGYGEGPSAGFYRVTHCQPVPVDDRLETDVYGELIFPGHYSECEAAHICQVINHPTQCEHWWHWGPERHAPRTHEEFEADSTRWREAYEAQERARAEAPLCP